LAVAAVVVTWQSREVVEACLRSLAEFAPEAEVVLIDNASTDGTCGRARGVRLVANRENRGFAAAVNQGFRETAADCVLVLNPDVRLETSIVPLEVACRRAGLAAGQLTGETGETQAGFTIRRFPGAAVLALELLGVNRIWPSNPWNRDYRYLDRDLNQPGPVQQPAGAFLMIRRDVWETLGGFDEQFYPVWFEDVDFCRRAAEAGYRIEYLPQVRARHLGGHSVRALGLSCREAYWYDSLLRYAAKHFRFGQFHAVCLAAMLAVVPRMVVGMIRTRSLKPIATGFYLLILTGRRLVSRPGVEQRSRRGIDN
jgi:N-acetylglucosaminyl-diphospho-decaprenol L-rhamnosyltransferase